MMSILCTEGVRIPTLLRLSPEGSIQYAFWNGERV
nr:MAG TPA: hypothetical protein [Caudoviricetes sp.]